MMRLTHLINTNLKDGACNGNSHANYFENVSQIEVHITEGFDHQGHCIPNLHLSQIFEVLR